MSLMDTIFGPANVTAQSVSSNQPANQPVVPVGTQIPPEGGKPAAATPGTAPNGVIPPNTATETKPAAPLDGFADLWKTVENKNLEDSRIFGDMDGNKLLEASKAHNFTKDITPEELAAIAAGGEGAQAAMLQIINKAQQRGHATSAHTTALLIEKAIEKASERFAASIPKHIRNHNTNSLIQDNPAFSHPAAKPMIDGLVNQLQVSYPDASPTQLQDMAKQFLTGFAKQITDGTTAQVETKVPAGEDWETYFKS